MSYTITDFKNDAIYYLGEAAEAGQSLGRLIITFDRSHQVWGSTPESQLQGRKVAIISSLVMAAFAAIFLTVAIYGCILDPGAYTYSMVGLFSFATLVALKETILQSYASFDVPIEILRMNLSIN